MFQDLDPTCLHFPLKTRLLSVAGLGTTVLAAMEWEVCSSILLVTFVQAEPVEMTRALMSTSAPVHVRHK